MNSYSHLGEDIYCFQNFINVPRRDVVLIEVGAYDGISYSNTFALEEYLQCKCILVEPSPLMVREIYKNRPNAAVHNVAIMSGFGICEFVGDTPVSGVQSELSSEYLDEWGLKAARNYKVMTAPLSAIIEIEKLEYIDFLSIDVQGAEYFVLSSMNWSIPVGIICIELEGQRLQFDEACRGILRGMGFQFKCRLLISEFWYKPEYFRAGELFDPDCKFPIDSFNCLHFSDSWRASLQENFV